MAVPRRRVVCRTEELAPGERRLVNDGPFGIGVFNVDGRYYALANYCPHRGGPLCVGEVTGTTVELADGSVTWDFDGEVLRCPWHNWEFFIATGRTVSRPEKRVRMHPVHIEDGMVVVEVSGGR